MKFLASLKDKRFRYGTMSTAMMIFALVIFVLVNLLADEFNRSRDLTAEQLFSLTTQSHRFLAELDMDVTLTYVTRTGAETHMITQLFAEYTAASPRITTEVRDPMINPAFIHQFLEGAEDGIPNGSVIVQSDQGFEVITPWDLETRRFNPQTGRWFTESFNAEREITQAIHSLTLGEATVIYHIIGSGETPLPPAFVAYLESENFVVREHNAVMADIPETADALFITMPDRDWGTVKADRIMEYLDNYEGRVFMALGLSNTRFPQLERVLNAYGLVLGNFVAIEGNLGRTVLGNPTWMLSAPEPHEFITLPWVLQGFSALFVLEATGIDLAPMRRPTTNIEPLFATSRDAYGRLLTTDADTILRVPEDIGGPFMLAAAVTDQVFVETTRTTRIVVVSSPSILIEEFNDFIGGGNWAFVSSALNWLQDQPAGIWVPVRRPPGTAPVMITDAQALTMSGIVMGVLPIGLLGVGIFIWFRRRHS